MLKTKERFACENVGDDSKRASQIEEYQRGFAPSSLQSSSNYHRRLPKSGEKLVVLLGFLFRGWKKSSEARYIQRRKLFHFTIFGVLNFSPTEKIPSSIKGSGAFYGFYILHKTCENFTPTANRTNAPRNNTNQKHIYFFVESIETRASRRVKVKGKKAQVESTWKTEIVVSQFFLFQ